MKQAADFGSFHDPDNVMVVAETVSTAFLCDRVMSVIVSSLVWLFLITANGKMPYEKSQRGVNATIFL